MTELAKLLQGWIWWWRLRQVLAWGLVGLASGLALALGLALLLLADGRLLPEMFVRLAVLAPAAGLGLGVLLALAWPFPRLRAARYFDRRLGMQERVSTALELHAAAQEGGKPKGTTAEATYEPETEIHRRQLEDALASARNVEVRRILPLRIPWPALALSVLLALGLILTGRMGAPGMQSALQAQALEQAVERAIAGEEARLDEAIREIEQNPDLTAEQRQELIAPLEEARRQLQEAGTPEEAVSALTEAQGRLQALAEQAEAQTAGQDQALRQAGESLRQSQNEALREAGESLAEGDPAAAGRALEDLDASTLTDGEREGLAEQLEAAASSLDNSNPSLAQELREAASALREGNAQAAQESLERAAQELAEAGQTAEAATAQAQAAQQAASELAQGQQAVAQAGAQGQTGQEGAETGTTSGQNQGGQAGSGAGQGEGNGAAEPGGEVGSAPIGQDNQPGDGGEQTYEPVYAPEHLGGEGGPDVGLPGGGEPGQPVGPEQTVPGVEGPSQVPYNEVFPTYAEAYRQAIESGQVPLSLQDVVRDYFSALNPEGN